MTKAEAKKAVKRYLSRAWPVSALSAEECWRKAHAEFGGLNCSVELFRETLTKIGFVPIQTGECHILRLPGPSPKMAKQFLRCEGL